MNKRIISKSGIFVVVAVFVLSLGASSFAKTMWAYLNSCSYGFEMTRSTASYDYIDYGGSTTTGTYKYAYVYAEVQKLNENGEWEYFDSMQSTSYMSAGVEDDDFRLDPGYTYRLKITHKVYDMTMNQLESYTHYSSNYIVSMPR